MKKGLLLIATTSFLLLFVQAQGDWKLKTDKEGIKVYTGNMAGSKLKAIKIESTVQATLSQMAVVLLDINTSKEWVYNTKTCMLVKQVSPAELYYYSEINVPWPISNRDFVAHIKLSQNPATKVLTMDAENVPDLVPRNENNVRVLQSTGKWVITPVERNVLKVEYTLFVDPGGMIPAWLINMFATKGPFESFRKLKTVIKKPLYSDVHLAFIKE